MINAFTAALRRIYATIPIEVLEAAFRPTDFQVSLDQRIKDCIISARVLPDCNINAGKIKRIPLSTCLVEYVRPDPGFSSLLSPTSGTLYRVPAAAREYRDIVGLIDLAFPYDYIGYSDAQQGFGINGNTLSSLASAVLDSHTHRSACLTPTPILMANNVVSINPNNSFLDDWVLIVRLGYDDEFTNLSNSSVYPLTDLIVTACKAYIWTRLIIRIDQGVLEGGQALGTFKAIVDSYQSAIDEYPDKLDKLNGSALFDPLLVPYLIRSML